MEQAEQAELEMLLNRLVALPEGTNRRDVAYIPSWG